MPASRSNASRSKAATEVPPDLPPDPVDERLSLAGASVNETHDIYLPEYRDIRDRFTEPPPALHPDPTQPGLRHNEVRPEGLRTWDDHKAAKLNSTGRGWIALHPTRRTKHGSNFDSKWFNVNTWGTWRMSFLLARLQRQIWEANPCPEIEGNSAAAGSADSQIGKDSQGELKKKWKGKKLDRVLAMARGAAQAVEEARTRGEDLTGDSLRVALSDFPSHSDVWPSFHMPDQTSRCRPLAPWASEVTSRERATIPDVKRRRLRSKQRDPLS